jgi:hypothetical protein
MLLSSGATVFRGVGDALTACRIPLIFSRSRKESLIMTMTLAPSIAAIRSEAPEEIPVLDLGAYLSGVPGARAALGHELRHALE